MDRFDFKKNNFDLVRLMAALQVAIVHGFEHLGVEQGRVFVNFISIFPGVPIFFVISGFLISASWERDSSLGSYIRNRVLRIYPALWACLLFSVLTVYLVYPFDTNIPEFFSWVLAQTTFVQFYNPEFLRGYGVGVLNGSLWTIPVELQFYVLLPFLYLFFDRIGWRPLALLLFLLIFVGLNQIYIGSRGQSEGVIVKLFGVSILPYLYMFLIGVLLQRNLAFVEKYLASKALLWLLVFLVTAAASRMLGFNYSGNDLNPILAISIALLTISFSYSYTARFSTLLKGNDISYGVYIYHMVIVNVLVHSKIFTPGLSFFVMLISTVLIAYLSWVLIEKRALLLKKRSLKATGAS